MKSLIKITAILLFIFLQISLVASCSKDSDTSSEPVPQSSATSDTTSSTASIPEEQNIFPYELKNYGGRTVTIYTVASDRHKYGELQFSPSEELATNVINEAVAERNNFIEENYGIVIKVIAEKYPTQNLVDLINGDAAEFDIVCDSVDRMVGLVSEKVFFSVDSILNLDDPWWDDRTLENLSLDGQKHFFVSGDCMITDVDHIYLTLFNKKILAEHGDLTSQYGDIYTLVNDNKFTLDVFTEMSKAVSLPDENGEWGFNATYGNLSHSYGANIMVNGAGVAIAEKDSKGELRISLADEHSLNVFDKVYKLMSNKQITSRAELVAGKSENVKSTYGFAELEEQFISGRGLFYNTTVASVSLLKDSDKERNFDFGVLPIPLFDDTQTEYYCAVNRYQSSVIGIPICNKDNIEISAYLLNLLGYYNRYSTGKNVLQSYYEATLKIQATSDSRDEKMLDLIFDSKFYDLGSIFSWSTVVGLYGNVIANDTTNNIVSAWDKISEATENAMRETIEQYKASLT